MFFEILEFWMIFYLVRFLNKHGKNVLFETKFFDFFCLFLEMYNVVYLHQKKLNKSKNSGNILEK